jgi:hypothetical protein
VNPKQQNVKKGKTLVLGAFAEPTRVVLTLHGKVGAGGGAWGAELIVDDAVLTKLDQIGQQSIFDARKVAVRAVGVDVLVSFEVPDMASPTPAAGPGASKPRASGPAAGASAAAKCVAGVRILTKPASVVGTGGTRIDLQALATLQPEACRPGEADLIVTITDKTGKKVGGRETSFTLESASELLSARTALVRPNHTVSLLAVVRGKDGTTAVDQHTISVT